MAKKSSKKITKTDRIRNLISTGRSNSEIAAALAQYGVTPQNVAIVRNRDKTRAAALEAAPAAAPQGAPACDAPASCRLHLTVTTPMEVRAAGASLRIHDDGVEVRAINGKLWSSKLGWSWLLTAAELLSRLPSEK